MKRLTIVSLVILLFMSIVLPSCEDLDDDYSTNAGHRLSFSVDTLSFDTVFSTIGSATREFMIYNKNSEPLNMETIELASSGSTGFRINVDGRKGYSFQNIGILPKDSMYVFVEVTVNPNGTNQPLLVEDSVVISVNGIKQRVLLEAYGQDVHLHKNGFIISRDTVLTAERPYLIYDSLVVAHDTRVLIEKDATFYMHDKANVIVYGTLMSDGEQDAPVTVRGDRLDNILTDLPYDHTPAQWGGVFFHPSSYGNRLNYTIIRNGETGLYCKSTTSDISKLKINNSQITNMGGHLLTAINSNIEVTNSELSNAVGSVAALLGGKYSFVHSTLSNQMVLLGRKDTCSFSPDFKKLIPGGQGQTLILSNAIADDLGMSLQASFDNCIIDGNHSAGSKPLNGEILFDAFDGVDFNYSFNHCVLKTKEEEGNANFTGSIFITKSLAYRVSGKKDDKYAYDFRLDSATVAGVGKADPAITELYPVDRYGVNRLTSSDGPTIGAYEFVPKEEEEEGKE